MSMLMCLACRKTDVHPMVDLNRKFSLEFPTVLDLFTKYTFIELDEAEYLPTRICSQCYQIIVDFHKFRKMCMGSYAECLKEAIHMAATVGMASCSEFLKDAEWIANGCYNSHRETVFSVEDVVDMKVEKLIDELMDVHEEPPIELIPITYRTEDELNEDSLECVEIENKQDNNKGNSLAEVAAVDPSKISSEIPAKEGDTNADCNDALIPMEYEEEEEEDEEDKDEESFRYTYGCWKCGFEIKCAKAFHKYRYLNVRATIFRCEFCPSTFDSSKTLQTHRKKTHFVYMLKKDYYCLKCCKRLQMAHRKADPQKYRCNTCTKKFFSRHTLRRHILREHKNDEEIDQPLEVHECKYCKEKFSRKQSLQMHLKIHPVATPFACSICEFRTTSKPLLIKHKLVHSKKMTFLCELCPYVAHVANALRTHLNRTHFMNSFQELFECMLCDKSNMRANTAKLHMLKHKDVFAAREAKRAKKREVYFPELICEYCSKKWKQKTALIRHIRTEHLTKENADGTFACLRCDFVSASKPDVLRHQKMHAKDEDYECEICKFLCHTSKSLRTHFLRQHSVGRCAGGLYVCYVCGKRKLRAKNIEKHFATHKSTKITRTKKQINTFKLMDVLQTGQEEAKAHIM